ncbi:unnamed protein product [Phytophthora lilii]|uniref:3-methyl-2-oxobutanoate hydroxymethyltransferase n=1 Tax=Phytophthora lilii TaxID=2077276 RepID=A0A9W6XTP8_9STRA|nr:unnamed protein product [Phytophthora lilii]
MVDHVLQRDRQRRVHALHQQQQNGRNTKTCQPSVMSQPPSTPNRTSSTMPSESPTSRMSKPARSTCTADGHCLLQLSLGDSKVGATADCHKCNQALDELRGSITPATQPGPGPSQGVQALACLSRITASSLRFWSCYNTAAAPLITTFISSSIRRAGDSSLGTSLQSGASLLTIASLHVWRPPQQVLGTIMRSMTAIARPALRRSRPAVCAAKLFSSDASSSSSTPYNAESAARTLKLLERRKVSTLDIGIFKRKKKPITMVTAYDYPSAVHVDLAGFDILLVGDSLGMVELVRFGINGGWLRTEG